MGESGEALTTIADGTEYALLASSDGSAYVLRNKTDRQSANLQGDDLIRFKTDYETIVSQYPAWAADQTLAQLWDQGGYSWLATEDEA